MTGSETHRCMQALRLQLLDMCRLSQKCVDCSMKAIQSGRQDFSTSVLDNTYEMTLLRIDAKEITRDLMVTELPSESDIRFVFASMRISDALRAIQKEAFEIAQTCLLLQNEGEIACADLATTGDLANRLMRLCTVAIFEEEIAHAEVVLRTKVNERLIATTSGVRYRQFDRNSPSQAAFVWSIAERVDELIRRMHEIARAIVFWLGESKRDSPPETYIFQPVESFAASRQSLREFEPDYCI